VNRLITIIVPVYNVEQYLDRCVESIVNQTYKNIEIILVDDGSPDNCPRICDDWERRDSRITVIHKKNEGLSAARNDAIKIAKGDYFLLVDSDDYIVLDAVEKFETYAVDEDVIIGEAQIHKLNQVIDRVHTNLKEDYTYSGQEYSIYAIKAGEWFAPACYNMYRTDFIRSNELYFKVGILHEDIEYLPRLMLAAKKVKYMHYMFYKYMTRDTSICSVISEKHLNDLIKIYSEWARLNETIENKSLQKAYAGVLSKYFISTCRQYKVTKKIYPDIIDGKYLILNSLNFKERIKAIAFVVASKIYVSI